MPTSKPYPLAPSPADLHNNPQYYPAQEELQHGSLPYPVLLRLIRRKGAKEAKPKPTSPIAAGAGMVASEGGFR